jgi:hypothetical protein
MGPKITKAATTGQKRQWYALSDQPLFASPPSGLTAKCPVRPVSCEANAALRHEGVRSCR